MARPPRTPKPTNAVTKRPKKPGIATDGPARGEEIVLVVIGHVTLAGRPFPDAALRAELIDMRGSSPLGESASRRDGSYVIRAATPAGADARVSLQVSVLDQEGKAIGISSVSHITTKGAITEAVVDVTVSDPTVRGPSEYDALVKKLKPSMRKVALWDLTDADIGFLAGEASEDPERITWLRQSSLLSRETNGSGAVSVRTKQAYRPAPSAEAIPPEVFYAWLTQGLRSTLSELVTTDDPALIDALERSQRDNIITPLPEGALDRILARMHALRVAGTLQPSSETGKTSLGDLLQVALPPDNHEVIAATWIAAGLNGKTLRDLRPQAGASSSLESTGGVAPFLAALERDERVDAADVSRVRTALALDELTDGHLPLVRELSRLTGNEPGTDGLATLARLDEQDWRTLLQQPSDPGNPDSEPIGVPAGHDSVDSYARALASLVEARMPTQVAADRIGRDTAADSPFVEVKTDLLAFFDNNPRFVLGKTPVRSYLSDDAEKKMAGVADPARLRHELTRMGRVAKFAGRFEPMKALLADGIDSAQAALLTGKRRFAERYEPAFGGKTHAEDAFEQATIVGLAALNIYVKLGTLANDPSPWVLDPVGDGTVDVSSFTDVDRATWKALFGSLDLCDCADCQSLYGPAAYYADLLMFIRQLAATERNRMPVDVLFGRRPDLAHLELTCDNANIRLPYVDLVNEVLEDAVADPSVTIIGDFATADLDRGILLDEIRLPLSLGSKAKLVTEAAGQAWAIREPGMRWEVVMNEAGTGIVARPFPQTAPTEAELRANPQYVNAKAYEKLAEGGFPWSLPFNLPVAQARVYLHQLGVDRDQLMAVVKTDQDALADEAIAAESLGLSSVEAGIITGTIKRDPSRPAVPGVSDLPWTFWGFDGETGSIPAPGELAGAESRLQGNWVSLLKRVPVFLAQSGLHCTELLSLLDTWYVNPEAAGSRTLTIVSTDKQDPASCDPDKLEIYGLNAAILARIHRFVRLRRALDWTARDLDRALTAFAATDLTPTLLIQLALVRRLKKRLTLPIPAVLAFWHDVDVAAYTSASTNEKGTAGLPSLYAELFRNKAIVSPVDEAFTENPASLTGALGDHVATILGALRLSAADMAILTTGPRAVTAGSALNLANLSALHRHGALANALKISVADLLQAKVLIGGDPFASAADTVRFVDRIDAIRASGFDVATLAFLLRNETSDVRLLPALDKESADLLTTLRTGLVKIDEENATGDDPLGEVTRTKLVQLRWSDAHVERVIALLGDTETFGTALPALPADIEMPAELAERVSYDAPTQTLSFRGVMSDAERLALRGATVPAGTSTTLYVAAVDALFAATRSAVKTFIAERMRAFALPVFSAPAGSQRLQQGVAFPEVWKNRIQYDRGAGKVRAIGPITDEELVDLLALSNAADYQAAVTSLVAQAKAYVPDAANRFLIVLPGADPAQGAFTALFDAGLSSTERFEYVLSRITTYVRKATSEGLVKQALADAFNLDVAAADGLLTISLRAPSDAAKPAIADLVDAAWVHSEGDVTPEAYPEQFAVLARVRKVAMLAARLRITANQLLWIGGLPATAGWVSWNLLPVTGNAAPIPFAAWERLVTGLGLRGAPFRSDDAIRDLLLLANDAATTKGAFMQALADAGKWSVADVTMLLGAETAAGAAQDKGLLNLTFPDGFRDGEGIARVRNCFRVLKRLGASVTQLVEWTQPDLATSDPSATRWKRALANANAIKNAVKAKYNDRDWLELAKPLQDKLRVRQRDALVDYLVAGRRYGVDQFDLYDYFLIDVEMGSCMMTTRLKQATCSVQLFVQRALMNLEAGVKVFEDDAKEWNSWRKLFRVWEANRKVFLYPENWIEPELRDDKSPIFEALENELLQNDVTADTAADAFEHYLERLDQVGRLEIVGTLLQREDALYSSGANDILHVFGRTYALPHLYFYRRRVRELWSPWEKVDLDIEGDHLVPAVWNDHLYLTWPIFTEQGEQQTKQQRANNDDPAKFWEIKLAWSEYKHGRWTPKKLSREFLKYVKDKAPNIPQEREDFMFLAQVETGAFGSRLAINCYGTSVTRTVTPAAQPPAPPARPPVLVLAAGGFETANVRFWVNEMSPADGDLSKIVVQQREHSNNSVIQSFNPGRLFPAGTGVVQVRDKATDYWFVPGAFSIGKTASWSFGLLRYVDIDLQPFHAATPTAPGQPTETIKTTLMQSIGRFQLDDCRADVHALPVNLVSPPIQPTALVPLPGTTYVDTMMVEAASNWADTFVPKGVLGRTPGTFRVLPRSDSHQDQNVLLPFVFQDGRATFVVNSVTAGSGLKARFESLYHSRVCEFMSTLDRSGLQGLLTLDSQSLQDEPNRFVTDYIPNSQFVDLDTNGDSTRRTPKEDVDFRREGAYSQYNWELFFHAPLLIATKLSKNQRFEEARNWFHFIFDPTASAPGGRERFWKLKPFVEEATQSPTSLEAFLRSESEAFDQQVAAWRASPFQPFVLARLRILAFMKMVVMKYVDNLIAWGDHLFSRDTIESINEATQLYVLAARILGKRPESMPARANPRVQTFNTVSSKEPNAFFVALVEIESYVFPSAAPTGSPSADGTASLNTMPLFCVPKNDKLLGFWDTVADRLFKIRHCQNIAGVVRELPIFDPPIDPALLVRAAAAGVDLDSVLNDLFAPLPQYRYSVMDRRASDLCNDVKGLGSALLAALEKRDAEGLSLLRSAHEIELLAAVKQIRDQQVDEAKSTLEGLREYEKVVTARQQFYQSRQFMNSFELAHAMITASSLVPMGMQIGAETTAAILHLIPDTKVGAPTTMGATYGGRNVAGAIQAFGSALGATASTLNTVGSLSSTIGGYTRRQEDWTHQADLATKELEQVGKQIAAGELRVAIAEHERDNQMLQVAHSKEVDEFMRRKYTNVELYDWMVGQLSALYFQSYRLAYDVAKRAERCYRYELGLADSNFIQFGYWDSLKKGLLAGERLQLDLRRMETDYADRNKRDYEITKHVSLLSLDPAALIRLRESQQCEIAIPEAIFDMECPGHYLRRIKSVSLTIPCVTGPYVGVNCTLTLLKSAVRRSTSDAAPTETLGVIQSVVTSSAQNDTGLFETSLNDERYLPFEGAGAISTWRLELPSAFKPFDYSTISDVVLHVRYTARNGGDDLKQQVVADLATAVNDIVSSTGASGLTRLVSLRHEFPTQWYRFLGEPVATDNRASITLGMDRFPYLFSGRALDVGTVEAFIKVKPEYAAAYDEDTLKIGIALGSVAPSSTDAAPDAVSLALVNGLLHGEQPITGNAAITSTTPTQWTLNAWRDDAGVITAIDGNALEEIMLAFHYSISG